MRPLVELCVGVKPEEQEGRRTVRGGGGGSPPLAKKQPAKPPLQAGSAFPNATGAVEDTRGSCIMERRLQRNIERAELPAVMVFFACMVYLKDLAAFVK